MTDLKGKQTAETRRIEKLLRPHFPDVAAYRHNRASIRVRIIDKRFRRKSVVEREQMVDSLLETLPEKTQVDLTILLLLSPDEVRHSMMNLEFEDPVESML